MKKTFITICVIIVILSIIFEFWALSTYGGKPTSEVPLWALWFLFSN